MFNCLVNAFAMPMGRVHSFDGVSFHDCSCPQYHLYNDTLRLDNLTVTAVSPHLPDLVVSHDPSSTPSSSRRSQNHTFVFHEKGFNKTSSKTNSTISQVTNSTANTQTTPTGNHSTHTTIGSSNGNSALTVSTRTVATQVENTDTRNSSTYSDTNSRNSLSSRAASWTGIPPVSPTTRGGSRSFGFVLPFENAIHDDNNENEKSPEISILDTSDSAHQTQVESEETESLSIETIDENLVDVSRLPENLNSNFDDNNSTFNSTSTVVTSNNRRNHSTSPTSSPSTYDEGSTSKFGNDPTVNFCKIDVSVNMEKIQRLRAPQNPAEDEKDMRDVDLRLKQMLAIRERLQTDPTYDSNSTLPNITPSGLSSDLVPFLSTEHQLHQNRVKSTALAVDYPVHHNPDDKLRLRWELPPPIPPSVSTTAPTCGCDHSRELLSVMQRGTGFDEAGESDAVASAVMTKMGEELRKIADDFQMTRRMRNPQSWKSLALLEPLWLRQHLSAPARQTLAITVTSALCWRLFAELLNRLR